MNDINLARLYGDLYTAFAPMLEGIVQQEAERYHNAIGIDRDDACQEARIALLAALPSYDYNRSRGNIHAFARTIVQNALRGLICAATTQSRMPHVAVTDESGTTRLARYRVGRLTASSEDGLDIDPFDDGPTPEERCLQAEADERIRTLRMRLMNMLTGRAKEVFTCIANPSESFLTYLRNVGADEPTIHHIGAYLRCTKNEVDWAIHTMKRQLTELLESPAYADLIRSALDSGKWPAFHVDGMAFNLDYVCRVIRERRLDPRMDDDRETIRQVSGRRFRVVEYYNWGAIAYLFMDEDKQATVIMEGAPTPQRPAFNWRTGELLGINGYWKQISDVLDWYPALNRILLPKKV